jgi:hypothetical protein
VINVEHRALIPELNIPAVLYGPGETPARPAAIVSALAGLLRFRET